MQPVFLGFRSSVRSFLFLFFFDRVLFSPSRVSRFPLHCLLVLLTLSTSPTALWPCSHSLICHRPWKLLPSADVVNMSKSRLVKKEAHRNPKGKWPNRQSPRENLNHRSWDVHVQLLTEPLTALLCFTINKRSFLSPFSPSVLQFLADALFWQGRREKQTHARVQGQSSPGVGRCCGGGGWRGIDWRSETYPRWKWELWQYSP